MRWYYEKLRRRNDNDSSATLHQQINSLFGFDQECFRASNDDEKFAQTFTSI